MASHPASYPWPPLAVGVPCPDPGHQGYGMQMDAEVLQQARMFLRGMDYSKKMWQDEDGDTHLNSSSWPLCLEDTWIRTASTQWPRHCASVSSRERALSEEVRPRVLPEAAGAFVCQRQRVTCAEPPGPARVDSVLPTRAQTAAQREPHIETETRAHELFWHTARSQSCGHSSGWVRDSGGGGAGKSRHHRKVQLDSVRASSPAGAGLACSKTRPCPSKLKPKAELSGSLNGIDRCRFSGCSCRRCHGGAGSQTGRGVLGRRAGILHIYTAKGLREYAYAAAEDLSVLGRLDSKEHKGKTALLVAVTANQPEIVHDLLQLGADVNACDVKGQTALHLAATYGFPQVMQAILSMGLNVDLEARNFEGLTPLHCAAISHGSTVKALCATPGLPDATLQNQAEDKLICVQLLLGCGASLLSQDIKSNKTVLHLAVKDGNLSLVHFPEILTLSPLSPCTQAHGNTALHMAAGLHGHPYQEEMIQVLLGRGADPSVRNLENDQPAHLLQAGERGEQLKLILKKGRATSSRRRIVSS
ncbi:IKBD inhibitor, partial [Atractosteus spatula]|nr:IKBD inhibitor [Atractosteus spatula]